MTGLLYIDKDAPDFHATANTVDEPLSSLPYEDLTPGAEALQRIQRGYR